MTIKDIKFMNGEGYLLKEMPLSLEECESQMKEIDYDHFYDAYRSHRDEAGVEKTQFPSIIYAFYSIVFNLSKIPTPPELLNEYYSLNANELVISGEQVLYRKRTFKKLDLDARVLRTYPSLIRDYHFYLMLLKENCFDKVVYSCKNDIAGKDLIVQHKGKEYVVSLFVKTRRSNFFKGIKNAFRHKYGANEIQVPLDLNAAEKCGDFFVYDIKHVEIIKRTIIDF